MVVHFVHSKKDDIDLWLIRQENKKVYKIFKKRTKKSVKLFRNLFLLYDVILGAIVDGEDLDDKIVDEYNRMKAEALERLENQELLFKKENYKRTIQVLESSYDLDDVIYNNEDYCNSVEKFILDSLAELDIKIEFK